MSARRGAALALASALLMLAAPAFADVLPIGAERDTEPAGGRATETVDVRDNSFAPETITIEQGDTVRWEQSGTGQHSVTADDGSFDSHPNCPPACMGEGDEFEQTFDDAGTVRYYCKIHGGEDGVGMAGRVVVEAASDDGDSGERAGASDDDDGAARRSGGIAATGSSSQLTLTVAILLLVSGAALRIVAGWSDDRSIAVRAQPLDDHRRRVVLEHALLMRDDGQ